ncbi:hypothetical protein Tco_0273258 [Tanacetum coccineum]
MRFIRPSKLHILGEFSIGSVAGLFRSFGYVLPGWEGSSHDGRVLRDAISMPQGLRFLSHDPQESVLDDDDNDDEEEEELENKDESEDMEYVLMAASSYDRGRGKNKHFWKEKEVEVLVDVLQELDSDPLWKVDGGFKNNYMVEYNPISKMLMQSGCQWDDVGNDSQENAMAIHTFKLPYYIVRPWFGGGREREQD